MPRTPPLLELPLDADADESVADVLTHFLADLDALEHHELGITSAERETDTSSQLERSKPKRKRVRTSSSTNTSWKRQKNELAALLSSIEALEAQRTVLQQRSEQRSQMGATTHEPSELRSASDATVAVLKQRLEHEVAAHERAVVERTRLLKLTDEAQKTARSIGDAFTKHPLPLVADVLAVCPELRVLCSGASAPIYRRLERLLDARCSKRQPFEPAAALANRPLAPHFVDSLVTHMQNVAVVTNAWLAPFPPDIVTDVLWESSRLSATEGAPLRMIQRMGSTLFVEKQLRLETSGETRNVAVYFVIKRYVDAHEQVTVAWESLVASGSATCTAASRFCTSTVLEPVVSDTFEPHARASTLSDARAKFFADAVVPTHQLGFAARMQVVENALLDLTLSAQRS